MLSALPDAAGRVARKAHIARNAPARLPIRADRHALLAAARCGRIPARLSRDAGGYLCNYLYWHALRAKGPRLAAFVHVPHSDVAADLVEGGEALLRALVAQLQPVRNCISPRDD
jgi:pyroglutamyl-peptidase